MAREMLLAGVKPEELLPNPPAPPPKTPREKLANFWYHYKWQTIGVLLAATMLTVMLCMTFSEDKPDYQIVLVTEQAAGSHRIEALTALLTPYGTDLDGDGKVEVAVENLMLTGDVQSSSVAAADTRALMSYFASGERMLFVFEPDCFEQRIRSQENADYVFFDSLTVAAAGYDEAEHYWDWSGDARREQGLLAELPPSLYFGVRAPTGTAQKDKCVTMNEQGKALLQAFIDDIKG